MTKPHDYYNEWDGFCADWLCNLMEAGLIPAGDVDRRSIRDVQPSDLIGYRQCHFFAGIGGWPLALQLAGFPDDLDVWTGSCPCQPFSAAGKRKGTADDRHLWPEFQRLIAARKPPVVFGEQVASKDGRLWLAGVRADLEALGYAVGGADLCAAGVGAAHIRQRLWWVADACTQRRDHRLQLSDVGPTARKVDETGDSGAAERLGDSGRAGSWRHAGTVFGAEAGAERALRRKPNEFESAGSAERLANPDGERRHGEGLHLRPGGQDSAKVEQSRAGGLEHAESDGRIERGAEPGRGSTEQRREFIPCLDGKTRRVEPGTFPLAHGVPARVGQLRAYGNAIHPEVAAEFIGAWLDCRP